MWFTVLFITQQEWRDCHYGACMLIWGILSNCTEQWGLVSHRKCWKMNPVLTDRATATTTSSICSEKEVISSESDKVNKGGVEMDGNNHERLTIPSPLTNQRKGAKLFRFNHTQDLLNRAKEATASNVLSTKRLKCQRLSILCFRRKEVGKKLTRWSVTWRAMNFERKAFWSTPDTWVTEKKHAAPTFKSVLLSIYLRRKLSRPATVG